MENITTGFKQDGEKCRWFILLSTDRRIIKYKEVYNKVGFLWKLCSKYISIAMMRIPFLFLLLSYSNNVNFTFTGPVYGDGPYMVI